MTDESAVYPAAAREFSGHGTVNHSIEEYVRGQFYHTNTVENYFSILKRGIMGTYRHVSRAHFHRSGLGVSDAERAIAALKGIDGKRLTYREAQGR